MTFSQKIVWYYLKYYFLWQVVILLIDTIIYSSLGEYKLIFLLPSVFFILSPKELFTTPKIYDLNHLDTKLSFIQLIIKIVRKLNLSNNLIGVSIIVFTGISVLLQGAIAFVLTSVSLNIQSVILFILLHFFLQVSSFFQLTLGFSAFFQKFLTSQLPNFQEKSPEEHARLLNSFAYHNIKNATVNMEWAVNALAATSEEKENLKAHIKSVYETLDEFRDFGEANQKNEFEANELSEMLEKLLGNSLKRKGITFGIEIKENKLISQSLYDTFHVINNLIINASNAFDEKIMIKKINILITFESEYTLFYVSDTGFGITKENQERVFEPYYSTTEGSSGLGLPSVRAKLAEMGGTIQLVDSLGDNKTTFLIKLRTKKR